MSRMNLNIILSTVIGYAVCTGSRPAVLSAQTIRFGGSASISSIGTQNTGVAALHPVPQGDRVLTNAGNAMTILNGHVPPWALTLNVSATPVSVASPLGLILLLRRSPAAEAAFQSMLQAQQTPGNPLYHQRVSPEQLGNLYGPTTNDVAAVTTWAQSQGLTAGAVDPARTTIQITGTVGAIEAALHVQFNLYNVPSGLRRAPNAEPIIPSALAPVIDSIGGLTGERSQSSQQSATNPQPAYTGPKGNHVVTPTDFATIYDVSPIYTSGNTGAMIGSTTQHIAIVARSDVNPTDIQAFAAGIGSTSYHYNVVLPSGTSPGLTSAQNEAETDLERVLGTAPGVTVDLVEGVGTGNGATGAVYDAASYAVMTLKDPIVTVSFGDCESDLGSSGTKLFQNLWSVAASNMTSVFVSAGDAGAAECDAHGVAAPPAQALAVNGLCSSAFDTCVGGTEFNDAMNPLQYWSPANDPTTEASALSYIPEGAWNDPTHPNQTGYLVSSGGGGVSQFNTEPSWQTGVGVPTDGFRHVPDISFTASPVTDPYYVCLPADACTVVGQSSSSTFKATNTGGTSATAPTMAGVTALLNTAAGAPQGNLDPTIYRLANSAVAGKIFHDVTVASSGVINCDVNTPSMCNNSTPGPTTLTGGQPGYLVGTGYDEATGWGSLDIANFIKAAVQPATSLSISSSATAISTSQTITVVATLTAASQSLAAPTGSVHFYVNGIAVGSSLALSGESATSSAISFPSAANYTITAVYSGDALYLPSTSDASIILVSSQPPSFTLAASPWTLSFTSGATSGNSSTVTVDAANNYAGNVVLTCSLSTSSAANQPTCAVSPATATLALNGSGTAVVTITSATAHALMVEPPLGSHSGMVTATGASLLAALFFLGLAPRRRRWLPGLSLTAILVTTMITLNGCSGPNAPLQSSSGIYTVTITGTGTGSGALTTTTASKTFAVTIR